jgi:hypothetical protein
MSKATVVKAHGTRPSSGKDNIDPASLTLMLGLVKHDRNPAVALQFTCRRIQPVRNCVRPPMRRRLSSPERRSQSCRFMSHGWMLLEACGLACAWRGRPAGRSKVWAGSLPATSYPCRPSLAGHPIPRPPKEARARPRRDTPSTETAPARAGLPRSDVGALTPRDGLRHALSPSLLSSRPHSFVRPAPRAFFRPDRGSFRAPRADRVKADPLSGSPQGLALTRSSTVRGWGRRGVSGIITRPSS